MTERLQAPLNDWQTYHRWIDRALEPGMTVLDVGCGRGDVAPYPWEKREARLVGLDVDPSARDNPALDEFIAATPGRPWDFEPGRADLALARYVFEHVEDPESFLKNVRRALKPDGVLLFLTPNRRHPAIWASRRIPLAWKRRLLARAGLAIAGNFFPTHYRMNTDGELRRLAERRGFRVIAQETREYAPCRYLEVAGASGRAVARVFRAGLQGFGWEPWLGAQIVGRWRRR